MTDFVPNDPTRPDHAAAPNPEQDARSRAVRTFVQGFGVDLLVALLLVLGPAFVNIEWSLGWWATVGLAAARSVLQAAVAYVMRKVVPPASSPSS